MGQQKPSIRAMFLRYHYRHTFYHCLDTIKKHEQYSLWWEDMDTFNRAYVLRGKIKRQGKRR